MFSEESCESFRRKLTWCFGLEESDLSPGPGGLVPGIFKVLTVEVNDPDVHIHHGKVPVGVRRVRRGHHYSPVEPRRLS